MDDVLNLMALHWKDYEISAHEGRCQAVLRSDPSVVLQAGTPRELGELLQADAKSRRKPRTGYWVERMSGPAYWVDLPGDGRPEG
jgi:hypothetical protein